MSKLHPWDLACFDDVAKVIGQAEALDKLQDVINRHGVIDAENSDITRTFLWGCKSDEVEYWAKLSSKIEEKKWQEGEERMNNIGRTGNDGVNKYSKEIKKGVFIDVYDVLNAFNVTNPATAHAVKKLLMPGQRGAKDMTQDLTEARNSINRAIEMEELGK